MWPPLYAHFSIPATNPERFRGCPTAQLPWHCGRHFTHTFRFPRPTPNAFGAALPLSYPGHVAATLRTLFDSRDQPRTLSGLPYRSATLALWPPLYAHFSIPATNPERFRGCSTAELPWPCGRHFTHTFRFPRPTPNAFGAALPLSYPGIVAATLRTLFDSRDQPRTLSGLLYRSATLALWPPLYAHFSIPATNPERFRGCSTA